MVVVGVIVGTAALGLIVSLFGDRYECSPEEIQEACEELSNISNDTLKAIEEKIGKNVTIVNNAAYGYVDISNMNAYAPAVQDSITNLIGVLDKQAQIIEEYNNGSAVEKMLGTGTMAILNLTEGVLKFTEDIVDAGANIIAGVGTFCGFDMEEVELWAAKDLVGDAFDDAFENGTFSWVEKYSIYSHESTAAEVLKGVGTAIPYIALAAAVPGVLAEAGVAAAAGFGRGSTNYQQRHLVYDANGEASFDETYSTGSMMDAGVVQAGIDAVVTVGMDYGIKALGKGIKKGISKLRPGKGIGEVAEAAAKNADDVLGALDNGADDLLGALDNGADDVLGALDNGADDAVKAFGKNTDNAADNVLGALDNGADDAVKAFGKNTDNADLSQIKQDLLNLHKSGKLTTAEMMEEIQKITGNTSAKAVNSLENGAKLVSESAENVVPTTGAKLVGESAENVVTTTGAKLVGESAENVVTTTGAKLVGESAENVVKSSTPATGYMLGSDTIAARMTRAYDNTVGGLKNAGEKAWNVAKGIANDTAEFVKENPKRALIGGGIIAGEKALGNMTSSHIPTDLATDLPTIDIKTNAGIDDFDNITPDSNDTSRDDPNPVDDSDSRGGPGSGGNPGLDDSSKGGENSESNDPTKDNSEDNNEETKQDDQKKEENNNSDKTTPPAPSDKGSTVIINPPSNNNQGSSGVNHGGTYNNSGSTENNETELNPELNPELEPELPTEDPELPEDPIEEESVYTIPSNLSRVKENNKKTSSGSGILPVLGGLGAAAAVGVGAKMYLDNKKNNENGDDEDYSEENDEDFNFSENNDLLADEWNGEDTEFNYEDPSGNNIAEPDDDLGEM